MNTKSLFLTLLLIFSTIPVTALDLHLPAKEAINADLKVIGNALAPAAKAAATVGKVGFKVATTLGGEALDGINMAIDQFDPLFYPFAIWGTLFCAGVTAAYKRGQQEIGELWGEERNNPMRLPKRILAIGLGSMALLALKQSGFFAHIGDLIADARKSL